MFQKEILIYEGLGQAKPVLKDLANKRPVRFTTRIRRIKRQLTEYLVSRGLPTPDELCLVEAGNWRPLPSNWQEMSIEERCAISSGKNLQIGFAYILNAFDKPTAESIAAEICQRIILFESNKGYDSLNRAFEIGRLLQLLSSTRHLSCVERGKSNKSSTSKGGNSAAENFVELRGKIIGSMLRHIAEGHSVLKAAELAAKEGLGSSMTANRSLYYRHSRRTGSQLAELTVAPLETPQQSFS